MRWSLLLFILSALTAAVVSVPVPGRVKSKTGITAKSVGGVKGTDGRHRSSRLAAKSSKWATPAKVPHVPARTSGSPSKEMMEKYHAVSESKLPFHMYRKNAQLSPHKVQRIGSSYRLRKAAQGSVRVPHMHEAGDHVFEDQMLHKGLEKHGVKFADLPKNHREGLRGILNHPENMQFVSKAVNSGKGQWIKGAMSGDPIKPKGVRDNYIKASLPIAHHTANKFDAYMTQHKLGNGGATVMHDLLRDTYQNGKLHTAGTPLPALPYKLDAAKTPSPASTPASSPPPSSHGTPPPASPPASAPGSPMSVSSP